MGGLEGTLPYHIVGKINTESAGITLDARVSDSEWLVGKAF